jgi:hypothetical protein
MTEPPHLTRAELELTFLGESTPRVAAHVQACQSCQAKLGEMDARREALLKRHPPLTYVRALRAADQRVRRGEGTLQALGGALALAASVALLVNQGSNAGLEAFAAPRHGVESPAAAVALAAPEAALRALQATPDERRGKGASYLGVVRKRGEQVCLLRGRVPVTPGDSIRIRFTVDTPGTLAAGVVLDGGGWMPLFEQPFGAGTHTPAATLQVTATPGAGLVLLGAPDQVRRARANEPAVVQSARLAWLPTVRDDDAETAGLGRLDGPRDARGESCLQE